jgi:copper homeostasis protein
MGNQILLEVCADSVESALAAQTGGASRIELCSDLLEGGVTPSAGLIATIRKKLDIDLYVMIRPRGGDFCYTPAEFEAMQADIAMARQLGANGVVFGILREDGSIDIARTRKLVELARPLNTTFHRAFDMSRHLHESLEAIIEAGASRILTSGGEQKVEDGVSVIAELTRAARARVSMMVGGGITESNVRRIVELTGVREVHASLRVSVPSPMMYRNEQVSMGSAQGREYQRTIVPQERVERLLGCANGLYGAPGAGQI